MAGSGYRYSSEFMQCTDMNRASAERIVPVVRSLVNVDSVVDFGCAWGGWLAVWQANGVTDIQGLDGDYVEADRLLIPQENFKSVDLSGSVDLGRKYDLVQSLEVAEHIDHDRAAGFVDNLTRHGSVILFSAAPPGQGGEWHVNEQPYAYWRDLFLVRGYELFDCIRPLIVNEPLIQPWYRYNSFLYVHRDLVASLPEQVGGSITCCFAVGSGRVIPGFFRR